MLEDMSFNLSRGYLFKTLLTEKEEDMDEEMIRRRILTLLSTLGVDKIECYHTCLPSGYTDAEMVFDYLILYESDYGYKPIVIKNGVHQWSRPNKWFVKYYKEDAYYTPNELLDLVCESSKEKFYEFLKEKYSDDIRQDVLVF